MRSLAAPVRPTALQRRCIRALLTLCITMTVSACNLWESRSRADPADGSTWDAMAWDRGTWE